ncbi:MAG: lipid A biosynthesis acyltransferase [Curvibacter sp. RIFCSPHIGHO2_12_FULL_63_18]|nr:MAG: lipid A biosynthesis acyltransferase [Curvibacter sp. GWA2_63_95]OGP03600.1 MAG: lipid A biosynthesis acyltransferase [Curvibacter sp. RIFCSPHIGHO2_12_FULL_63_18]HCX80879.1 lipid A biosynthesis acyltransferase [Rhodoferax sp.]
MTMSRWMLKLLVLLGALPLPLLRGLGWVLGGVLYALVPSRRRVVQTNLALCFPAWTQAERRRQCFLTFVHFAQSWLDRGWLWHAPPSVVQARLQLGGALDAMAGDTPTVLFAPHFMGLDAAWTALTQQMPRRFATIYSPQLNPAVDAWVLAGRLRFGQPEMVARLDGAKPIVAAVRRGEPLYLLPDMNFDPSESLFVPFYGVSAATVPSLSRFAKLGRAQVVPVVTRITPQGYSIEVLPPWQDFPTADLEADTRRMNRELQSYIDTMPSQYYWVHKRFKDRPNGEAPPY